MAVVMALKSFIALEGQLTGCTPFLPLLLNCKRIKNDLPNLNWQYCTCKVILAGVWIVLILYLYKMNVRTLFKRCKGVCVNSLISLK